MSQPETFGRYQLLMRLARGGMGEVWLARQAGLDGFQKLVVIKRILPHLAEEEDFVNMFLDEGKIAARLNHTNIVNIFDLGQEGEYYFLAMEYIHGEDIRRIWKQAARAKTALPAALACRIIADACAGLDFAHKKADDKGEPLQIVHRDISPHNIIVSFDGGVKVIDFGIARARGRISNTATGALKGRFEYMSPEHASGGRVDHRTDIFALGVVLWESLSGRRLFKRDSDASTLLAVARCDVPRPSEYNPAIPPELDAVLLKALAHDPNDRYEDAGAFRLALEDWIIHSREAASNAHLAAFMRSLYADRLAKEASLGHPVIEEFTQSKTNLPPLASSLAKAGASDAPESNRGDKTPTNARGAGALLPWALGAALVLLAIVIALILVRDPATPAAPVATPTERPQPLPDLTPEPSHTAPPERVSLEFTSEPVGATVVVAGRTLGVTPVTWSGERSNTAFSVEVTLKGYKPYSQSVVPFETGEVHAALERLPPPPRPAPPPPRPTGLKQAR